MKKISIIVPIYNEKKTILKIIERIKKAPVLGLEKEIILVDDGSNDGSKQVLKELESEYRVIYHSKNLGKGAAVRTGFKEALGDIILIQDADLELNPQNYPNLLRPILENKADVVYGTRYQQEVNFIYRGHYFGAKLISWLTNLFYGSKLSDVYCGYKVFKSSFLKDIELKSSGFEIEQELTVKFLKKGYRILEVPVDYHPRKFEEGKKIKWQDGVKAVWLIVKHKIFL